MTQNYLTLNRGQFSVQNVGVTTASTNRADFTFCWGSTNAPTIQDCWLAMDLFKQYLVAQGLMSGSRGTEIPVAVSSND